MSSQTLNDPGSNSFEPLLPLREAAELLGNVRSIRERRTSSRNEGRQAVAFSGKCAGPLDSHPTDSTQSKWSSCRRW
ncbi:MAG TPA: hypothetical protein VH596_07850 [Terriglobales bacterium]